MQDLRDLIRDQKAKHRPRSDYSSWDNETLVSQLVIWRSLGPQCIIRMIAKPEDDWKAMFQRVSHMADVLSPAVLEELYSMQRNGVAVRFLIWWRLELEHIALELRNRLERSKVGSALIQAIGGRSEKVTLNQLLRVLRIERLQSYRPEDESDEDLRAHGLMKAYEYYDHMGEEAIFPLPHGLGAALPPNLGLPEQDPPPWDYLLPRVTSLQIQQALRVFLPILEGDVERLPGKVWQALRDLFEKRKAQKRDAQRADEPFETLEEAGHIPRHHGVQDAMSDLVQVFKLAERRWGPKATAFLNALREDCTQDEAAKRAKISRQTGHKYLRELAKARPS